MSCWVSGRLLGAGGGQTHPKQIGLGVHCRWSSRVRRSLLHQAVGGMSGAKPANVEVAAVL